MLDALRPWPARTILGRRIADRHHDIERLVKEKLGGFRLLIADVHSDLRHGPNRQRMHPSRRARSGRHNIENVAVKRAGQPLGHLAARRVACAEKENSFFVHVDYGDSRSITQSRASRNR